MAWTVYILKCSDGSLYTGITNDLDRRMERHASGKGAAYTRSRLPVRLVYRERSRGQGEALRREWAVKQLTRAEKLRLIRRGRKATSRRRSPSSASRAEPAPTGS